MNDPKKTRKVINSDQKTQTRKSFRYLNMKHLLENCYFLFKLSLKIKYEQKYLDDQLKLHIKELLEKLANVQSDDEDTEEKENLNDENDDEYETLSEEENEHDIQNKDHSKLKFKKEDSKLSENFEQKKRNDLKSKDKRLEESMEFT